MNRRRAGWSLAAALASAAVLTALWLNGGDGGEMTTKQPDTLTGTAPDDSPSGTGAMQAGEDSVAVTVDLSRTGPLLTNKFSDLSQWELGMDWLSEALAQSEDYMRTRYPFVRRVQLMSASGGSETRDLFVNPLDRQTLDDYDFSRLGTAVKHILRQGLKPSIATGNVPLKYSAEPTIGGFGVNVRPPDDDEVYYRYIRALAQYMVDRFGLDEVRTWTWRALVEYENVDWFDAGDPESTKQAYFKLYDYTVAALEEVIGAEHLHVGAHSMTNGPGYWDEREFIDHVAHGTNYYTGQTGTQLDFLSFSYYDVMPGQRSPEPYTLAANLELLRERALQNGLTELQYGVDEGRIASGPDSKELFPRSVATSYQSAYDARLFKEMHDIGLDYFAKWYVNTERVWSGVDGIDPVGTHLANLAYRMTGGKRVAVEAAEPVALSTNEVDGIAAYDEAARTARLLLYNFNEAPDGGAAEAVAIGFDRVRAAGDTVKVTQWIIDDEHANYWPQWQADLEAHGVAEDDFGSWSSHSWTIGSVASPRIQKLWYDRIEQYRALSRLEPLETTAIVEDGQLRLTARLAPQAVVLYEIEGIEPLD
ncbi:GH39 family glycosyl hydrolase [Paenibacillus sp. 598K]|uniref:GH39 family glycosyl hydrolase n=1 Tax=Paenibacillus sp. 598K TaxID=1117987 RepID=UPI0016274230|nr:hypothetical protein [Paenibacillus sp. 598K]